MSIFYAAFGIPGVTEHAHFLKDVRDARAIRMRLVECLSLPSLPHRGGKADNYSCTTGFEQASQPTIDDATRRKLLTFCIVGLSYTLLFLLP